MKLPNYQAAVVAKEKIVDYLLSTSHPIGRHKGVFFRNCGFSAINWKIFAAALMQHAADHEVAIEEESPFGKRYAVDGIMKIPNGRSAIV
jgi:hypothetical protein